MTLKHLALTALPRQWNALALFLSQLKGVKRAAAAFGFGAVMALSMPPFNLWPLLAICLPAFIFLLQGATSARQAFATGWSFAFGFFVFGLYWIAASMFVDIAKFWWAVPFAVAGLPAFFAFYYGLAAIIARRLGVQGIGGALAVGLLWFLADFARGHMFTGFPWNLAGYTWSGALPVLQSTSVIGIYGLTLLTALAACLPAALATGGKRARNANIIALIGFALIALGGEIRLQTTSVGVVPDVRLRIVQPNIAQATKWRIDEREGHFQHLLDLSSAPGDKPVTHIFWPETASTYYLAEESWRRKMIAARIPAAASVLTGVIRRDLDENGNTKFYNSLVALDGLGRLVAGYDKSHLVPFGEFMPLRRYIPLHALAASDADFSSGSGARSLRVLGLPTFSPLICYEAIFPGEVIDPEDRPEFLVNLTNDAWYGDTTGPYQHFAIVRVRAIEEGMPLIRSANTGISGVIDPLGRINHKLDINQSGLIDSDLPTVLPLTIFEKTRNSLVWIVFLLACGIVAREKKRG